MHVSATEKRANEILNENNMKLTAELVVKETIIEGKQREIEKLSTHVKVKSIPYTITSIHFIPSIHLWHTYAFVILTSNGVRAFLINLPPSRREHWIDNPI